jgi:hypothetical protein
MPAHFHLAKVAFFLALIGLLLMWAGRDQVQMAEAAKEPAVPISCRQLYESPGAFSGKVVLSEFLVGGQFVVITDEHDTRWDSVYLALVPADATEGFSTQDIRAILSVTNARNEDALVERLQRDELECQVLGVSCGMNASEQARMAECYPGIPLERCVVLQEGFFTASASTGKNMMMFGALCWIGVLFLGTSIFKQTRVRRDAFRDDPLPEAVLSGFGPPVDSRL